MAVSKFPEFLTTTEAAAYLGVPEEAIQSLVSKGRLPMMEIDGDWRIHRDALDTKRKRHQWGLRTGCVALVSLDELSILVMTKIAKRFNLSAQTFPSGESALLAVSHGECAAVLLNEQLTDMKASVCYGEIRVMSADLPVVVLCESLVAEEYQQFLFCGSPVTFLHRPAQYQHAERLFLQLGFQRKKLRHHEKP